MLRTLATPSGAVDAMSSDSSPHTPPIQVHSGFKNYGLAQVLLGERRVTLLRNALAALEPCLARRKSYTIIRVSERRLLRRLARYAQLFWVEENGYLLVMDSPAVAVELYVLNRANFISLDLHFHARTEADLRLAERRFGRILKPMLIGEATLIDVKWYYLDGNSIDYEPLTEILSDTVLPEAYPYLHDLNNQVDDYLNSGEQVLILLGPPGTGKTRLIRHILGRLASLRGLSDRNLSVCYTTDDKVLNDSKLFIDFLANENDALVVEDLDFNLASRLDNNPFMVRLLGASDGFLRNQGRKILISTNLAQRGIDDALLRPGRCYAVWQTRPLSAAEATQLAQRLGAGTVNVGEEMSLGALYHLLQGRKTEPLLGYKKSFGFL